MEVVPNFLRRVSIDVDAGQILPAVFKLPYQWVAPDVIVAELVTPSASLLLSLGLVQAELSGNQVEQVEMLAAPYRRPSRKDLFSLVLARDEKAILVTGDRELRSAAHQEGVVVHGTLWVLDQMVKHKILDRPRRQEAGDQATVKNGSSSGSRSARTRRSATPQGSCRH